MFGSVWYLTDASERKLNHFKLKDELIHNKFSNKQGQALKGKPKAKVCLSNWHLPIESFPFNSHVSMFVFAPWKLFVRLRFWFEELGILFGSISFLNTTTSEPPVQGITEIDEPIFWR